MYTQTQSSPHIGHPQLINTHTQLQRNLSSKSSLSELIASLALILFPLRRGIKTNELD